ncbi:hypothetical protein Tco_1334982 [Tanacetum coccineum]
MSIYLKNMVGYKHSQLKSKSYDEIQKLFNKEIRVNTFVDMNSEVVKGRETRTEESFKRAGDELEFDMSKKQKIDKHVEVEKDDQKEAEMKRHIEIVKDDEVAIDAIPLATKPPVIVEYKIDKDGRMRYFKLIRADGSSKRPEEDYEIVLWGDLKVMFEPDIKSKVWRNLQGYKVIVWKLFDNCGVHFVRSIQVGSTIRDKKGAENLAADHLSRLENPDLGKLTKAEIKDLFPEERLMAIFDKKNEPCVLTESYRDAWPKIRQHKFFDNVTTDHLKDIMASPPPQGKSLRPSFTGHISYKMHISWYKFAMHVNEKETSHQGTKHLKNTSKSMKYSMFGELTLWDLSPH